MPERPPPVRPAPGFPSSDLLGCLLRGPGSDGPWVPPLDVVETPKEIIALVALPGIDPSEVTVSVGSGVLHLCGDGRRPSLPEGARIRRMELPVGAFERSVAIPDGHYQVTREVARGCLILRLVRWDGPTGDVKECLTVGT